MFLLINPIKKLTKIKNLFFLCFTLFFINISFSDTILTTTPNHGDFYIINAINSAQHYIKITMYGFTDKKIATALIKQKNKGVNIQLLIEGKPYNAADENTRIISQLKRAHIDIHYNDPTFSLTHQKTIIIDHQFALIMTGNFTYSGYYKQRNFIAKITDANIIENLDQLFDADWNHVNFLQNRSLSKLASVREVGEGSERRTGVYTRAHEDSSTEPTNKFSAEVELRKRSNNLSPLLVTSPENSAQVLIEFIKNTKQKLDIYALELTDKRIINILLKKSSGIKTRILINNSKQFFYKKKLCQHNIEIHRLANLQQHAKALLRDHGFENSLAYVGSANLSYYSLSKNREVGVLFSDKAALKTLNATFEKDWKSSVDIC